VVELYLISIHYVEATRNKVEITMKRIHRKIMYYTRTAGSFAFVSIQNGKLLNIVINRRYVQYKYTAQIER
jgi:hypothetical protein